MSLVVDVAVSSGYFLFIHILNTSVKIYRAKS